VIVVTRSVSSAAFGRSVSTQPHAPLGLLQPFIEGLKVAKVDLNRKALADIAATDSVAFAELVKLAQNGLKAKAA